MSAWLCHAEAENNLLLGVIAELISGQHAYEPPIYLACLEDETGLRGCAFRTPPFPLGLTHLPRESFPALAADLAQAYPTLPGIIGPEASVAGFAQAWSELTAVRARPAMRQRIYELTEVSRPEPAAPGRLRVAHSNDLALACDWTAAFVRDTGVPFGEPNAVVEPLIERRDLHVWELDGQPRSIAAAMGATPNGVRVGLVYTPPEQRGRGFASALVAELSQRLLDRGRRFCFLYTDLSNPTTNAIYQRLGYVPVCDSVMYEIGADA